MNRFFKVFYTILLLVFLPIAEAENTLVSIEDWIVGAPYEVTEVDGKAPQRAQHGMFVTVVPLVLVSPGAHELTLKSKKVEGEMQRHSEEFLSVAVQAGKRYRLVRKKGKPSVVEIQ